MAESGLAGSFTYRSVDKRRGADAAAVTFQDLMRKGPVHPERSQLFAEDNFPDVVRLHGMHLWRPGDPFVTVGERFLLGIVTWSNYDLQLLDELASRIQAGRLSPERLDLFNIAPIHKRQDLEPYIPGLSARFTNPPALEIWNDGVLREQLEGYLARKRLFEMR
jgi:hypothetical protein